ncbi:DUF4921 family protein [Candidatus Woesearchaeota archaeon]|nr:DUF4921 family protein [Candidatus Woesearchaeota archaeon]
MPQIRKDYILDKWVIIATERSKRPMEFSSKHDKEVSPKEKCPFCPGNEHMIPGVIEEIKRDDKWVVRAIWNKYKAAAPGANKEIRTDNEFYTFGDSVGEHEVVIETPDHGKEMEDLDEYYIVEIIRMINRRINDNYKKGAEYVAVFKNRGGEAGASLSHAHHQLVAYNLLPTEIRDEFTAVRKQRKIIGGCPYCKIIDSEKESERSVFQDENFIAFAPYASRFPLECWILPKKCHHSLTELCEEEIISLAKLLKSLLGTLNKLNYPAYNIVYKISRSFDHDFHFRIEILPRLAKWAGFEYTTGTIINTITPENAAKFYRGED